MSWVDSVWPVKKDLCIVLGLLFSTTSQWTLNQTFVSYHDFSVDSQSDVCFCTLTNFSVDSQSDVLFCTDFLVHPESDVPAFFATTSRSQSNVPDLATSA